MNMKRLLLQLLAGAAIAVPLAAKADVESTYTVGDVTYTLTPVTSTDQLTEDAQYIIRTYSTHFGSQYVFTHSSSDAVTNTDDDVLKSDFASALWSIKTDIGVTCTGSTAPQTPTYTELSTAADNHFDTKGVAFYCSDGYFPWTGSSASTTLVTYDGSTIDNSCAEVVKSDLSTKEQGVFYVHYGTSGHTFLLTSNGTQGIYSHYAPKQYYGTNSNGTFSPYITIYKVTSTKLKKTSDGTKYLFSDVVEPSEITEGAHYIITTYNTTWESQFTFTHSDTQVIYNGSETVYAETDGNLSSDFTSALWGVEMLESTAVPCTSGETITAARNDTDYTEQHTNMATVAFTYNGKYMPWGQTTGSTTATLKSSGDGFAAAEIIKSSVFDTTFYVHLADDRESQRNTYLIPPGGSVGVFSGASDYMILYYSSDWSGYITIRKVETLSERLATVKAEVVERINAQAASVAANYGITVNLDEYINNVNALTVSDTGDLTDLVSATKQANQYAVAAADAALNAVQAGINNRLVTMRNSNTSDAGDYTTVATTSLASGQSSRAVAIQPTSVWKFTEVAVDKTYPGGLTLKLYCPFANAYIGGTAPTADNATAGVTTTESSALTLGLIPVGSDNKFLLKYGGGAYYLHRNITERILYYNSTGEASQWILSEPTADERTSVYTTAASDLKTEKLGDKEPGTELGQYDVKTSDDNAWSYDDVCADFTAACTADEFESAATAYLGVLATDFTITLNMPAAGTYLRIKGADGYVTADAFDANETDDGTIMWYSGETLVDYQNGFAFTADGEFGDADDLAANVATTISIDEASTAVGKYKVAYGDQQTTYADGLGLSKVASLPVTLPSDGQATIIVPVALQIPEVEGCSFYVAVIRSDYTIRIHKASAGEVYAAHTAIIINGTAGTVVDMPIAYDASAALGDYVHEGSGSTLRTAFTTTEGFTTYAKQTAASVASAKRRTAAADGDDAVSVTFTALTDEVPANTVLFELPNKDKLATSHESITATMPTATDAATDDVIFNAVEGKTVTTSIGELTADSLPAANDAIYDLMGRRVVNPGHGIFIKNNKIFIK